MNDPEKAKYLEENLAAIPDCAKSAVNGCLGTLTNLSYMIDANGNIIETASGTNDPDGKIAKENAERKAKENREKEEKVKEKRAAKKAEEEKAAKKRAEKLAEGKETGDYTLSVTGNDVKDVYKRQSNTYQYATDVQEVRRYLKGVTGEDISLEKLT